MSKATYMVRFSGCVVRDVEVEAESPEEAIKIAKERPVDTDGAQRRLATIYRGLRPESVDDLDEDDAAGEPESFEVVGQCEACMVWLLEGRDEGQSVDDDGVRLCGACCKQVVAEAGADEEPLP